MLTAAGAWGTLDALQTYPSKTLRGQTAFAKSVALGRG